MQHKKTYKAVGIFITLGFLCLLGIIFNYTGKKLLADRKNLVVMYFDESIQGLSVGSSVVLQGVEIGQVDKIRLVADIIAGTFKTPVYVLFDKRKILPSQQNGEIHGNLLNHLIEKGLRARLISANYLTGQLMIELIIDPKQPPIFRGNGKYREIPTVLSAFAKISKDFNEIPLHESMMRLGDLLIDLDDKLPPILDNITQITGKFNTMLNKNTGDIPQTLNNLNTTMEEITKVSRSIKNLTDYLERYPEAIIRGKEK